MRHKAGRARYLTPHRHRADGPITAAAASPLLAWREPIYIQAGFVRLYAGDGRPDRQGRTADLLCRLDFLILDELGYLQFAQTGGRAAAMAVMVDDRMRSSLRMAIITGRRHGAARNSGQRCTAVKRILVQNRVADRFVGMVLERAKQIVFGDPMDPATNLGTVVHAQAAELFERRVHMAAEEGASILYNPGRQGALLPPIVVDHVPHGSELVMEETFGPIVPIIRAPDDDDALIALSNSTAFGLSSGVCTNDFRRMRKYIAGLKVVTGKI